MLAKSCWTATFATVAMSAWPLSAHGGSPAAATAEPEKAVIPEGTTKSFRIRKTDHFVIAYDTPYEALRPLMGRLEGAYRAIRRFSETQGLRLSEHDDAMPRLQMILFDDCDDFVHYGEILEVPSQNIAGFYHQQTNVSAFCNMLGSPDIRLLSERLEQLEQRMTDLAASDVQTAEKRRQRDELQRDMLALRLQRDDFVRQFNRYVVQHEASHQMFFNLGVHVRGAANPGWLVEGLACQFEVPQGNPAGRLTAINQMRLADFRRALQVRIDERDVTDETLQAAADQGRWVPLADLIGGTDVFQHDDENMVFRYAQSWALVFYLHRRQTEVFAAYLRQLQDRQPRAPVTADAERVEFETFFGKPDAQFEREWIDAILRLQFVPP